MNESVAVTARPWLGLDPFGKGLIEGSKARSLPASARFLCRIEISLGIDEVEADFLVHTPKPEFLELWSNDDLCGIRLLSRSQVDESLSQSRQDIQLLFEIFKAWRNFQWPVGLVTAGSVDEREWRILKRRMKMELRRKGVEEIDDAHGLLQTAEELGLNPAHDGGDSEFFICACPGRRGHHCYLKPATGQWYCGWCPRGGGSPTELREFYKENQP